MNDTSLHRAFWAVCPPEACIRRAARLIEQLRDPLRKLGLDVGWVRPASLHITMKFLGDVTGAQIAAMIAQLGPLVERATQLGQGPLSEPFVPTQLILFESTQQPDGMHYTPLHTLALPTRAKIPPTPPDSRR